jgi:hypothetical protein
MTVGSILQPRGGDRLVPGADPAAAQRMAENDVGTLVILEATDVALPIGMVTDRDIVLDVSPPVSIPIGIASAPSRPAHCIPWMSRLRSKRRWSAWRKRVLPAGGGRSRGQSGRPAESGRRPRLAG